MSGTTFLDKTNPIPIVLEMIRIFPDGLVITSGIYAMITQSIAFGIFCMSMVEASVLYHILRFIFSYLGRAQLKPNKSNEMCSTGFRNPQTLNSLSIFSSTLDSTDNVFEHFPSSPVYMISAASGYLFSTLTLQKNDLEVLGPEFSVKYYISIVFLSFIIFTFIYFRMAYNCESMPVLALSAPIGFIVGIALVQQNIKLFNKSGINLLGIPQMTSVTASGQKIYVCPGRKREGTS
jgi:hypothetical protein